MTLIGRKILLTNTDASGNPTLDFPITSIECVEGAVTSVNGQKGDAIVGTITDVDISGTTITISFADGTTKPLTTQDTNSIIESSLETDGYTKFSNGLILQWGTTPGATNYDVDRIVTFPIEFSSACFLFQAINKNETTNKENMNYRIKSLSTTTATIFCHRIESASSGTRYMNWFALGI